MTALNDPTAPQTLLRAPRLRVLSGTTEIPGVISFRVDTNNQRQAGGYAVDISTPPGSTFTTAWWGSQSSIRLTVQAAILAPGAAVSGAAWQTLIVGDADTVEADPITGIVRVMGRDLTALLIDKKTADTYQNQTASQVATLLAQGVGLTPVVTATTTLVGTYYQQDHTRTSLNQFSNATTEWDLLTYLADQEQFDVFVQGTSLYFQPKTLPTAPPYELLYTPGTVATFNGKSLKLHRSMTLAKDIKVTVRSWSSKAKSSVTVTLRGSIATNAGAVVELGPPQTYVFVKPGLTHAQATVYAQQKLNELSKHERVVSIDMPGELTLTPRDMVSLSGTASNWDQVYYVDAISRSMSWTGFSETLRIKNHSPLDQAIVS